MRRAFKRKLKYTKSVDGILSFAEQDAFLYLQEVRSDALENVDP